MSDGVFQRVAAVNVGLAAFGQAVRDQGAEAVDVDWRPPAGGDAGTVALLEALWGRQGEGGGGGHGGGVRRSGAARPGAVTVARAGDAIDGLDDGVLLHSGP